MNGGRLRRWLFLVVTVVLTGCAISKPIHQPGLVTHWDRQGRFAQTPAPQIKLVLNSRYVAFDDRSMFPPLTWISRGIVRAHLVNVLPRFPSLANASFDLDQASYTLVIDAVHTERASKLQTFLSAATIFLIPNRWDYALELEGKVYRGTALLKTYKATGRYVTRCHLIFLLPVGWHFGVPGQMKDDTFADLFLQIQQDASDLFRSSENAFPGDT